VHRVSVLGVLCCAAVAALLMGSTARAGGGTTMVPFPVQAGGVTSPLAGFFGNDSTGVQAVEIDGQDQGGDDAVDNGLASRSTAR
jgi:hypothetical protein